MDRLTQTIRWLAVYGSTREDVVGFVGPGRKIIVISFSARKDSLFKGLERSIVNGLPYRWIVIDMDRSRQSFYEIESIATPNARSEFIGFVITVAQDIVLSSGDYTTTLSIPLPDSSYQITQTLEWLPVGDLDQMDSVGVIGTDRKTLSISPSNKNESIYKGLKTRIVMGLPYHWLLIDDDDIHEIESIFQPEYYFLVNLVHTITIAPGSHRTALSVSRPLLVNGDKRK